MEAFGPLFRENNFSLKFNFDFGKETIEFYYTNGTKLNNICIKVNNAKTTIQKHCFHLFYISGIN